MADYEGYELNDEGEYPNYTREIQLFHDIIDHLPPNGTTYVSTQHRHSALSTPSAGSDGVSVNESGEVTLPFMTPGVVLADAAGKLAATGAITSAMLLTPGDTYVLVGGTTGIGGSASLTHNGTTLTTPGIRTTVGTLKVGANDVNTVGLTYASDVTNTFTGTVGIDISSGWAKCFSHKLGQLVDMWFEVYGETGIGENVEIPLPYQMYNLSQFTPDWCVQALQGTSYAIGHVYPHAGMTGMVVHPDAGVTGWQDDSSPRKVRGHIRYYAVD
jgi:hypothetical protein